MIQLPSAAIEAITKLPIQHLPQKWGSLEITRSTMSALRSPSFTRDGAHAEPQAQGGDSSTSLTVPEQGRGEQG
jgi:hypothetical protein